MNQILSGINNVSDISDWEKAKRGETKKGFRLWRLYENEATEDETGDWRVTSRVIVDPPCPKYDNFKRFAKWTENEPLTVLELFNRRRPNKSTDDSMLVLRRYSTVDPSIYAEIARIVYEGPDQENHCGWSYVRQEQLNERVVAIRFVHLGNAADRIVLIDTHNRLYRQFEIPPAGQMLPLRMFLNPYYGAISSVNFSVIYADMNGDPPKFVNILYEIEESQEPTFPTVRQLWLLPLRIGVEGDDCLYHLFPRFNSMQFPGVFCVSRQNVNGCTTTAFSFDHQGQCRDVFPFEQWIGVGQSTIGSNLGLQHSRAMFASDDFQRLVKSAAPREENGVLHVSFSDANPSYLTIYYGDVLGTVNNEGIVQRRLIPSSLKRQTAEAIRRSVPESENPAVITQETGVDIFDGILEEKKKSVLTIRLDLVDDEDAMIGLAGVVGLGV